MQHSKELESIKFRFGPTKMLMILTVLSFACITFDDTKLGWPILILALAAVFVGSILEKLTYLFILLSWLYLVGLLFNRHIYKRSAIVIAIGVLWTIVLLQGSALFNGVQPDTVTVERNHWFIGSSVFFLISSAFLLFRCLAHPTSE
ncbi:hypothetical protein [Spirosoma aerophilum]